MNTPLTELVAELHGEEIFRQVLPPDEYEIGREPELQIRLDSDRVSRRHAVLRINYFDWVLEDLGSINGTTVGDKPITTPTTIFPQQQVKVGNVSLRLRRMPAAEGGDFLSPEVLEALSYIPEKVLSQRKYRIRGLIAKGRLGVVLEAEDVTTRRWVAMKTLLASATPEDEIRFTEEAQILAQLEHPHIIRIYELNMNDQGKPFYTMQLVRGDSLKQAVHAIRLQRPGAHERWRLEVLLEIFHKVCDAIAYAHQRRIVHRDLKPENILIAEHGEVLVMNWSQAKVLGDRVSGLAAIVRGTPQFMPPEQATGELQVADLRADVYALGAMLYNLLTLHLPFRAGDAEELLEKITAGRMTPPEEIAKEQPLPHVPGGRLPARLAQAALKAMARNPDERYASVQEFQADIRAANAG